MNRAVSKRSVLLVAATASFMTPFMGASVNVALPVIGREFGADAVSLGWVSTAYMLAAAPFLVPFGRIADIVGRKRIFLAGVTLYGLAVLLAASSTSAGMLIACRAMEGAGGALIYGTAMAILTSTFGPQERGQALGINVASVYAGLALGPTAGGLLTRYLGWRSVFLVAVPLAALIVALTLWKIKGEWAEARGEPFDATGSLLYALTLVAVMYGFSVLPQPLGLWLILLGALLLAAFVAWELRVKSPVLDLTLFRRNKVFALSNLAAWLNYSATTAVGFLLSLYLQYIKGLSPQEAGMIMVAQPVVMALVSPLAGRLSDRVEPRIVASAGLSLSAVGLVLLTRLGAETPSWSIVGCLVFLGLGFGLFSSPNTNAIMSSVERRRLGLAGGMVGTMRLTGQMFSMGAAMLVFALRIGRVQITPEHYGAFLASIRILFSASAVLCAGGVCASLARGRLRREQPES